MFSHGVMYAYVGPFLFILCPPCLLAGLIVLAERMRDR